MDKENFACVCTTNEARNYFYAKGLEYSDIDYSSFLLLLIYLHKELKESIKNGETTIGTMRLENKFTFVEDNNGKMIHGGATVKSNYFKNRECITFNEDGFIGFAGWADEYNLNPILRAFLEWCDAVEKCSGIVHIEVKKEGE